MFDERWVHARIDSPLFASLMQAVELSVPAVAADAGAGRIFNPPKASVTPAYVTTGRLNIQAEHESAVHNWPTDYRSVFETLRTCAPRNGAFRLNELLNAKPEHSAVFGPLATCGPIVDAVGASIPVEAGAWCMLILCRCDPGKPFGIEHLQRVERLRAPLARVLRHSYQQELRNGGGATHASAGSTATPAANPASELLSRLSQTERRVLEFLCQRCTEREIAARMERSPHTIHVHVKNIYRKLAVSSRRALIELFEGQ